MSTQKPISVDITENNITIVFMGHAPLSMRKDNSNETKAKYFDSVKEKIIDYYHNDDKANWDEIMNIFVPTVDIQEIFSNKELKKMNVSKKFSCQNGKFYYKGYMLKNYLAQKIIETKTKANETGEDLKHLLRPMFMFLDNLLENPSLNSVSQLYRFVEHTKLPLTEDGCLLAYKIIRKDYTDKHTGKMDNSIGATVSMERNQVTDDPNQTCSSGLHFCSYNYATGFFNNSNHDRMVVIKINPSDVVSIPTDYNNEKGRCCKYEVLYEIPMEEVMKSDVLGIFNENPRDFDDDYEHWEDEDFEFDEDEEENFY